MKKQSTPKLSVEERNELVAWIDEHGSELPSFVRDALLQYGFLIAGLEGTKRNLTTVLAELRRALGITPSSEKRRNSGDPVGGTSAPGDAKPKTLREQIELKIAKHEDLGDWHREMARLHNKKVKEAKNKLMRVEDIELTPEEIAESRRENAEYIERLKLGDGVDQKCESLREGFMRGGEANISDREEIARVPEASLAGGKIVKKLSEERTRYDFSVNVERVSIDVEKVILKDGNKTRILSGSTLEFGPPRRDVTWGFLSNLTILVAQYAMPFNRLGGLLSIAEKRFTSAQLSRDFCYVANRLLPIYVFLGESLANSDILSGDSTSARVNEVNRYFKLKKIDEKTEPPWRLYATSDVAEETLKQEKHTGLAARLAAEFGFEFERKDGNGSKVGLNATVIWGRSDPDDPRSSIIFYRSCLGSFGNLIELLLQSRDQKNRKLIVQSDLATVNLITDPALLKFLEVSYAGCGSHARRPFAIHETDDPDNCAHMLHLFKGLYIYERGLDLFGRNETNILAVRGVDSMAMWNAIRELAQDMTEKWSSATNLGNACRYIIRNFEKLTRYATEPRLSLTNDFSEQMLRMEKLIQANALFRESLEGRFALDINRTVLQTANAAHASPKEYLDWVLKSPTHEVEADPSKFTPLAFMKQKNDETASPA